MVTLRQVLNQNSNTLGTQYENLGTSRGRFLNKNKLLLSYNKDTGWNLVQLNIFQLFLRKVFGFYKETHLKRICEEWTFTSEEMAETPFEEKIKAIWNRAYPNKPMPNPVYFQKFGNTNLSAADIYCYGEVHTDDTMRKKIGEDINNRYRPGDIILVEGLEAGKIVKAKDGPQTQKYLNPDFDVQGWEPENFEDLIAPFTAHHKVMLKKLTDTYDSIVKAIPSSNDYTSAELDHLKAQLPIFVQSYKELCEYFNHDKENLPQGEMVFNYFSEVFEIQKLKFDSKIDVFKYVIAKFLSKLEKKQTRALYAYHNPEGVTAALASIKPRNATLCQEIEKCREQGKRIFLIGGYAHFLHTKSNKEEGVDEFQDTLKKHKFTLFISRKSVEEDNLIARNKGLTPLPSS